MNCKQTVSCINRRSLLSDTQPLVLTRWTLVLIHDNGSVRKQALPFLRIKQDTCLKQAGTSLMQAYASLKQEAACL